jgi:S-adenosylmethionine decarboxylase
MKINDLILNNYLFEIQEEDLPKDEKEDIVKELNEEMTEIFNGINLPKK